jgi:CelD/BcsL family acetyltransferase involved in cellulose biosynthesis
MPGLQLDIVSPDAMSEADWSAWRGMVAADPELRSPYFRPEFTRIAARISPRSAVARFRRGGRTVAFLPFQMRGGALQPLAAPMNDYHGLIAEPGGAPALEEIAPLLPGRRMNLTAWVGDAAMGDARRTVQVEFGEGGFDAWYAERRQTFGKFFKDKERARRSMEAELGPLRVEQGLRDPALLAWLIALKRDQYGRTNRHDIFACGWTAELLAALMREPQGDFSASIAALWAGDRLVAAEYSLHAGDQCHFWFPGYEPSLARCSPGILLSMDTMRLMNAEGFRSFDFGFEGEHYKKYFCNAARTVREISLAKPGLDRAVVGAASAALGAAGPGGARLKSSVRRRWAAIEACETTPLNRMKGAAQAVGAGLAKIRPGTTRTVSA